MDDLYRDEILDHYRRPHNFGMLEAPDASADGSNPPRCVAIGSR
jgi:nitrogen fixation NifU-like protein